MRPPEQVLRVVQPSAEGAHEDGDDADDEPLELGASGDELHRDKDFAELSEDELRRVRDLVARIARTRPLRRSRRMRRDPLGEGMDVRGMIRRSLRTGGDPIERPLRARKQAPRRLVLLCERQGKAIGELTLSELQAVDPAFEADVYDAISLESCVTRRAVYGGPSEESVRRHIDKIKEFLMQ
jgi:hypothetical protein